MKPITISHNNGEDILIARPGMDDTWEILDIKVGSVRCKGIGRGMVENLIEIANPRIVYAFTREENAIGRAFYKALGFREILVEGFYKDGNAMLVVYENILYRKI